MYASPAPPAHRMPPQSAPNSPRRAQLHIISTPQPGSSALTTPRAAANQSPPMTPSSPSSPLQRPVPQRAAPQIVNAAKVMTRPSSPRTLPDQRRLSSDDWTPTAPTPPAYNPKPPTSKHSPARVPPPHHPGASAYDGLIPDAIPTDAGGPASFDDAVWLLKAQQRRLEALRAQRRTAAVGFAKQRILTPRGATGDYGVAYPEGSTLVPPPPPPAGGGWKKLSQCGGAAETAKVVAAVAEDPKESGTNARFES